MFNQVSNVLSLNSGESRELIPKIYVKGKKTCIKFIPCRYETLSSEI